MGRNFRFVSIPPSLKNSCRGLKSLYLAEVEGSSELSVKFVQGAPEAIDGMRQLRVPTAFQLYIASYEFQIMFTFINNLSNISVCILDLSQSDQTWDSGQLSRPYSVGFVSFLKCLRVACVLISFHLHFAW